MNWNLPLPSASGRRSTVVLDGVADSASWPTRRAEAEALPRSRTAWLVERGVISVSVGAEEAAERAASFVGAEVDVLPAESVAVTTTVPFLTVNVPPEATAVPAPP